MASLMFQSRFLKCSFHFCILSSWLAAFTLALLVFSFLLRQYLCAKLLLIFYFLPNYFYPVTFALNVNSFFVFFFCFFFSGMCNLFLKVSAYKNLFEFLLKIGMLLHMFTFYSKYYCLPSNCTFSSWCFFYSRRLPLDSR